MLEQIQSRFDTIFGKQRIWLHLALFILTLFTTTLAGVAWAGHNPLDLENLPYGLEYSVLLLLFLSAHEFGHFFAARYHNVDATLPFYIPFPGVLFGMTPNFGTFGAVIRTRSRLPSKKVIFDIGIAGPIAGFIVCLLILAIGFLTLPGIEYLQHIHPGYPNYPHDPGGDLAFGKTIMYVLFEKIFARSGAYVPPMTEIYHYPMLCAAWFGLFVTSLNLLPVGQLDGGHTTYGLFSKRAHRNIGIATVMLLGALSIPELLVELLPASMSSFKAILIPFTLNGGSTWFFWVIMILLVIRFRHPETADESPLDFKRKMVGVLTLLMFILCFTPAPLVIQ